MIAPRAARPYWLCNWLGLSCCAAYPSTTAGQRSATAHGTFTLSGYIHSLHKHPNTKNH